MIVVDASLVLEVLLQTSAAPRVSQRIFAYGETLHVPHLLDVEVAQVFRRYARSCVISPDRGARPRSCFGSDWSASRGAVSG